MNGKTKIWSGKKTRLCLTQLQFLKLNWFLKDIKVKKAKLLDLGCGAGGLTAGIKEQRPNWEIYGVDRNKQAIAEAKKRFPKIKFFHFKIEDLPLKNGFFQIISCFDVLEHTDKPEFILNKINNLLKGRGLLHLAAPLEAQSFTLYWLLKKFGWRQKEILAGHQQSFSKKSLAILLDRAGFKIIKIRYSFHLLGQILDILFYAFLAKKAKYGLEEEIEGKKGKTFLVLIKNVLTALINLESLLMQNIPAGCIHLTARKK